MASLQEKLHKIKSPKLQNQHHTAVVLSAVEDTLRDQHADFTATAYFAALLALLGQSFSATRGIVNKDLATSVMYLLDIVSTFVPSPLLRSKFFQILASLAPALTLPEAEAPLLKPSIGCLESLLVAQDATAWALPQSQIGPRRATAGLLVLTVDHRPKVRKRAQDALIQVLKHAPPSPALDHPAADMCAETALKTLSDSVAATGKIKKGRHGHQQSNQHEPAVMHALQLVKTIASASAGWPSKKIEPLCELLMDVSKSANEYLAIGAFQVFEVIFKGMADDFSSSKLPRLMEAITQLTPAQNDSHLLPPWIAVLSRGYDVAAQVSPKETFEKLPELFDLVSTFLTSPSRNVRVSASECIVSFLVNCIPDSVVLEPSVYDEKTLEKLAKSATGLLTLRYQAAWMEVFNVLSAMFDALKWRSTPVLADIVRTVGELRGNESFHGKKEADRVLGSAVSAMGPEAILKILPLNISNQRPGQPGRVWLLPILRDHVSNTHLAYFRSELVPLSEALFQRILDYGNADKTVEVKIFETLVQQTWSILPGFCELPLDLAEAFDQSFAELISNVLYKQTELRVDVCRALENLVESNQAIASIDSDMDDLLLQRRISKKAARENLAHLAGFSSNLLAVLFNVYSQTLPQFRGFILRCINAYLSITSEQELVDTFTRVTTMLESSLPSNSAPSAQDMQPKSSGDKMPPTSHTLMDLVVTMSIYLPRSSFATLFSLAAVLLSKEDSDTQLIKKAYKILTRLATTETGAVALRDRSSELQSLILATTENTPTPARRDRLLAIHEIVTHLPASDLHFIPSVLPEVVLGCRESNEKARSAAFALLVHLANRIVDTKRNPVGTVIRNSLVPHLSSETPDAPATIEEFFVMVSAGLAGSSPHMVAASVTAFSRLLFEFHPQLPPAVLTDLVQTVGLFLTSNNREIVRSALGLVKVVAVVLPEDILRPLLDSLVPSLMVWSKEHKGRLKSKVKGILDRLLRRFDPTLIERLVGEADRKLVVTVRKERERRKRRKKEGKASDKGDNEGLGEASKQPHKSSSTSVERIFTSEFDKAVYGSDMSDSDFNTSDSDNASEVDASVTGNTHHYRSRDKSKGTQKYAAGGESRDPERGSGIQYIRELSPESNPLDLLAPNALANISTAKPSVRFLASKKKMHSARIDADGKLLLGGGDHSGDVIMTGGAGGEGAGVSAYVSAITGPDTIRRGQRGRLKVSQGGFGRHRNADDEMELDDEAETMSAAIGKQIKGVAGKSGRRGLGMPKVKGSGAGSNHPSGRIQKRMRGGAGHGFRVGARGRVRL